MSHTIAIVSLKGGVGKTTTAVNLAACLADAGKRTLLIDGDPQGSATAIAGIKHKNFACSLVEALHRVAPVRETIVATRIPNLDLIPMREAAPPSSLTYNREFERETLNTLLLDIKPEYDYLVIDTPPSTGWFSLNGMAAADSLLIPLQCEYLAYASLVRLLTFIRHNNESLNPGAKLLGVLLTMYDESDSVAGKIVKNIRDHLKNLVFETIIPRSLALKESTGLAAPALLKHRRSTGAESYRQLAGEVIKRISLNQLQ